MKIAKLFTLGISSLLPFSSTLAYTDTTETPYRYAIDLLSTEDIIKGYGDGTFRPDEKINRAEFMKIITQSMPYLPPNQTENCLRDYTADDWSFAFFPDVPKSAWFAKYICTGKSRAVVSGYSDGNFRPADNVNYAEALKILYGSRRDTGKSNSTGGKWYSRFMEDAIENGIGLPINPSKQITRGEMAQLLVNYSEAKKITTPAINTDDFFTFIDADFEVSFPLPKEFEDFVAVPVITEMQNCPGSTYMSLQLIPKEAYDAGVRSYKDIYKNGQPANTKMPFAIHITKTKDLCNAAYTNTINYSGEYCKNNPATCDMYLDKRQVRHGDYTYTFVPLYNRYTATDSHSDFFFIPADGELRYMRDNFKAF